MTLKEYTDDGERVRPKSRAPYPISRRAREGAKEKIDSWVQRGLLKPSNSPWGSPLVAVAKVDSEGNVTGTRVTLDMRWVNKCVLRDHFPLRRLEDLLSRFGRFKVYSGVDLYDGFTQLPLHPDSQDLSAIVTPWGGLQLDSPASGPGKRPLGVPALHRACVWIRRWTGLDDGVPR